MKSMKKAVQLVIVLLLAPLTMLPANAAETIVTGLQGASGSTIGPGGAIYVTEGAIGRISRVNPHTGNVTTFAEGLPPSIIGIGGAIDIAFIGRTAYVLVTLVGPPFGNGVNGIYRVDGPNSFTLIADLGQFSQDNPPQTAFDLPQGLQYAIETYRGGFLVTDGHHNRVLYVKRNGKVSEFAGFENIVPTGLEVFGNTIFMAQAGEAPHLPDDGKIVAFWPRSPVVLEIAAGGPLLVDVERGRSTQMFGLAQGTFVEGSDPGAPALPSTGSLLRVNRHGGFDVIEGGLNLPTSMEIIGNTAYVVGLAGDIVKIKNIGKKSHGRHRCKYHH